MMWLGFAIAGGIDLINGTHVFFPIFPEIPVHQAEISRYFTEKPWNAMGWTPLYILPFGVGLGFLIPLEMSFSLWVFYLFWKGERILGKAMGLQNFPGFPYDGPQGLGAYLAIACFALYSGRRHFYTILKNIFQFNRRSDILSCQFDKSRERTEYRWTVLGLVVGLCLLGVFSYKGGMALWTAGLYFLIYYLLAIGITRIRAEVGPPTREMFVIHPRQFLISVLGTRHISPPSLTMMSLYYTFNRGYRAYPMPHTLEGFKLSDTAKMRSGPFVLAMMLAVVAGIFASFWAYLVVSYKIGANPGLGSGGYNLLRTWLYFPKETDFPSVIFICLGFLFMGFIRWMRTRFVFWPFHPAGYAIASSIWTFGWLWFSIFVSWAIKVILLRIGGIRLYHKMLPFFLGLLLGEFIIGGAWVLVRLFWNIMVYSFYR